MITILFICAFLGVAVFGGFRFYRGENVESTDEVNIEEVECKGIELSKYHVIGNRIVEIEKTKA